MSRSVTLVFLLGYYCTSVMGRVFHITTNLYCPEQHCLTLTKFVTESRQEHNNLLYNTTLYFEPGVHSLELDLAIQHISYLLLYSEPSGAKISCIDSSISIQLMNITVVQLSGLKFVNCGGNKIILVRELIIKDTTFSYSRNNLEESALFLVNLTASIVRSYFISNNIGEASEQVGGAI